MFQTHRQMLRPLTTAHLAQTMTLLSLTVDELRQQIDKELAQNPALEMVDERRCPTCHRILQKGGPCPVCSTPAINQGDEPVVFVSPRDDFISHSDRDTSDYSGDELNASHEDLSMYVLKQVASELDPDERGIAAHLLVNLNEDGLLAIPLTEIALYYHVTLSKVQDIQRIIQHADPLGVGSSTSQEALLVQLEFLSEFRYVPDLARRIISESMDLLSRRQFPELAHRHKTSVRQVEDAVKFISENLNPFPTRSHWGENLRADSSPGQAYHEPDIIISYLNGDPEKPLMVEIILPISGFLRVNPMFKQAIQQATEDKKEAWKNDLDRAGLFVKCIQQRNHTIERLIKRLVIQQRDFIIYGEKYLRPITRAHFSQELEVHESTISRAVSNKTVQLPNRRIIPMGKFFDRSLNVRTVLRDIIDQELQPLSDSELVEQLAGFGFSVARRTVAKYRSMENILPAHLRQPMKVT